MCGLSTGIFILHPPGLDSSRVVRRERLAASRLDAQKAPSLWTYPCPDRTPQGVRSAHRTRIAVNLGGSVANSSERDLDEAHCQCCAQIDDLRNFLQLAGRANHTKNGDNFFKDFMVRKRGVRFPQLWTARAAIERAHEPACSMAYSAVG